MPEPTRRGLPALMAAVLLTAVTAQVAFSQGSSSPQQRNIVISHVITDESAHEICIHLRDFDGGSQAAWATSASRWATRN